MSVARKNESSSPMVLLFVSTLLLITVFFSDATTYEVNTDGDPYSLLEALEEAGAGDTISLEDGLYTAENLVTVRGGEEGEPLLIVGGRDAVLNAGKSNRVVFVKHSWVTLEGFTVDGKVGEEEVADSYVGKCVYVQGQENATTMSYGGEDVESSLVGFVMENMFIKNCGAECIRLNNFVTDAQILYNEIENCGIHDYHFEAGGENGEGVYIGTSSKQWENGPDGCNNNFVQGNNITTNGNECVDIKEGSTGNIIEDNICSSQFDPDSGCFDSRGDSNTFRYNKASNCLGAGVRLGGWEVDGHQYGVHNNVYGNDFTKCESGAVNVNAIAQGQICENACEDGICGITGEEDTGLEDAWDQPCSS